MKIFDPDIEAALDPSFSPVMAGGAYEGASQFDNALALWGPSLNSADTDILPDKDVADARVRDIMRNDGTVQGGGFLHRDNIVGSLFALNSKPELRVLGMDEAWGQEFQEEVEAKFTTAAESPNCWFDAARMNTLTDLVRLAVGTYLTGGEVLAVAEWIKEPGRPFKTAIQMIELDRLRDPWDGMTFDKKIRGGIEKNRYGAPIAYHIRVQHPTDTAWNLTGYDSKRVPTRKGWGRLNVVHILEQMRIDQSRGISEMVASLKEMKITKKFRDVTLQQAVVAATYAASIESDLPPDAAYSALGAGNIGSGVTGYAAQYLNAIAAYSGGAKNMKIDGVKIPHFFPGTKLKLQNVGSPGGVGGQFEASLLRHIAANLGVSYEQLSKDYSQTNYSSIRAALSETWKFMQSRKRIVADRFASAIYRLWLEEMFNTDGLECLRGRTTPNWYEGLNADAYSACEWIGAGRGQIDELKETQAAVLRLKYHLTTYEEEMSRLGKDWRKGLIQREREVKELKARGLEVEEANSINAASGAPREAGATGDAEDNSDKEEKKAGAK